MLFRSWLDFEFDAKDIVYFRVDRRRKMPVTILLKALGYTPEKILKEFFAFDTFHIESNHVLFEVVPERLRGEMARFDINDKSGKNIVPKNKRIIDYAGELVRNNKTCEAREEKYLAQGCIWVFRVNRAWSRDAAVGGNVARFINHACEPNCWIEIADKTIWIRASRAIRPGEELTYDYRTEGERTIPCRCRPGCPNKL